MREEPDVEMREEYDFAGGTRGRFAARITARERDELLKRSAVQDLGTWIGHALLQVQMLEAALFTHLVLAEANPPERAKATAAELLSVRRVVGETRIQEGLAIEFDQLARLVAERNWLVHRGGYESQVALSDPGRRRSLLDRLEGIADLAATLRARVESLIEQHLARTGLSRKEIKRKTGEAVGMWLAA